MFETQDCSVLASGIPASSTLAVSMRASELCAAGIDVVSFSVGEPDFRTPEHIAQAAKQAIDDGFTHYTPAPGIPELRRAVADKLLRDNGLSYTPDQIVVSSGAKHSLTNALLALLNPGDEVLIPVPAWLSYVQMVRVLGGTPVMIETTAATGYAPTCEALESAVTPRTKALIITTPSNPTGMVYDRKTVEMIAEFAVSHRIFVIADEIYEKLIYDEHAEHISIASLGSEIHDLTITVNGLSKSYAMTGWRVGFAAANSHVAKIMSNVQSHTTAGINSIAQKAAVAALCGDQSCVEQMRLAFRERRDYIFGRVSRIPMLHALKPQGAFYLYVDVRDTFGREIDGKTITSSLDFAGLLLQYGHVALVGCEDFGVRGFIRISYATSMEKIAAGMDRLEAFMQQLR